MTSVFEHGMLVEKWKITVSSATMSSLDLCLMMPLPYFFYGNFAYNYFSLLQRFLKDKILYIFTQDKF